MAREYRYNVWPKLIVMANSFPDDMLRYDQAKIISQRQEIEDGKEFTIYTIQGKVKPTIGRWASFLYTVGNVEVV